MYLEGGGGREAVIVVVAASADAFSQRQMVSLGE